MPCGTCKWFSYPFYAPTTSEEREEYVGECEWPADKLPWSLRYGSRERLGVYYSEGEGCPCYEQRIIAVARTTSVSATA